jgi:hypothetical protein
MSRAEPKWINDARTIYHEMWDASYENEFGERLYEGNLTDLAYEVCGSKANYGRIIELLKAHGAIRLVRRGNRYHTSLIELTGELDSIVGSEPLLPLEHLTRGAHGATIAAALEQDVRALEAWRENLERGGLDVAKVLQDFERRLSKLEAAQNGS